MQDLKLEILPLCHKTLIVLTGIMKSLGFSKTVKSYSQETDILL